MTTVRYACRRQVLVLVVALAALVASPAHAQEPASDEAAPEIPTAPSSPREQARALYREGVQLAEQAEWALAYGKFAAAQELYPAATNVFNIGQCQRALGRYVGAIATFRELLALRVGPEHEALHERAESYLQELEARVARLTVITEPPGASVAIDGRPSSGEAVLDPGLVTVRVTQPGYTSAFVDRALRPGQRLSLRIRLDRLPAVLSIDANVGRAHVSIDGEAVGRVPWQGEREAGTYSVGVQAEGHEDYETEIILRSGQQAEIHATLGPEKVNVATRWWFWASVGAAVATAAVVTYAATREDPAPADYDGGSLGWVVTF